MKSGWSIPLFPVFGIKLELHLTFLLLLGWAALTGYQIQGAWTALWAVAVVIGGFTCVVFHELGHSLTARFFGIHTHRILLLPIGGMAQLSQMPRDPRRELAITIAGPAVNFALVLLLAAFLYLGYARMEVEAFARELNQFSFTLAGFFRLMLFYNLAMGIFNCLPVFPMDGGRILRATLAFRLPYVRATQMAVWIGRPIALGCLLLALWFGHWLLVVLFLFIFMLGELEWRFVRMAEHNSNLAVGNLAAQQFTRVPEGTVLQEAVDLCLFHQPAEIVVCAHDQVLAIFTPDEIRRLMQAHGLGTPLTHLREPPAIVQAHWPLATLGKRLESRSPSRIPVYQGERLFGILRLDRIDDLIAWHQQRVAADAARFPQFPRPPHPTAEQTGT